MRAGVRDERREGQAQGGDMRGWIGPMVSSLAAVLTLRLELSAQPPRRPSHAEQVAVRHAIMIDDNATLARYLRSGYSADSLLDRDRPITIAALARNLQAIKMLVAQGCSVNGMSHIGDSALEAAVFVDSVHCVQYLIAHGAHVNARTKFRQTAIFAARSVAVAKILIRAGARLDVADTQGTTPVGAACEEVNPPLVVTLIEAGSNVHVLNKWDQSLFIVTLSAAGLEEDLQFENLRSVLQTLRIHKVDPSLKDVYGHDAFYYLHINGFDGLASALR